MFQAALKDLDRRANIKTNCGLATAPVCSSSYRENIQPPFRLVSNAGEVRSLPRAMIHGAPTKN